MLENIKIYGILLLFKLLGKYLAYQTQYNFSGKLIIAFGKPEFLADYTSLSWVSQRQL